MKNPKPEYATSDLCERAARTLKASGFILHCALQSSESCYYRLPDREQLIRVSTHSAKGGQNSLAPSDVVSSKITFNGTNLSPPGYIRIDDHKVEMIIMEAIGRYFVATGGYHA